MARYQGRLELTWTNKDKALLSTGDGKYDYTFVDPSDRRVAEVRLLHEVERIEAATPADRPADLPTPTTDNLLITGDAMHVLDALAKIPEYADKYLGKVKLVYIDPPFNTGQAFSHYEDNIEHSVWLTLLRDRLRQIKPLLAPNASVWVHLDDAEVHRCRVVMDEELGTENFVGEVAWQKSDTLRNDSKQFSADFDYLLVYRSGPAWRPNRLERPSSMDAIYKSPDGDPRVWFNAGPTAPGARTHQGMVYAIQNPITGVLHYPLKNRCWALGQTDILRMVSEYADFELRILPDVDRRAEVCGLDPSTMREDVPAIVVSGDPLVARARATARHAKGHWPVFYFTGTGGDGGPGKKTYIPSEGLAPRTWWPNAEVGSNRTAKAEVKLINPEAPPFATPKPEKLLQRILQIASDPGDIVLDCFAGSGTTAAVAHKMGRRWVTSELLIGTVETFTKPRLAKVVRGEDPAGVTASTERVPVPGVELPDGVSAKDAQEFNRILTKVADSMGAALDREALKALRDATRTRNETATLWHGGGGFIHLEVGPSMFDEVEGVVVLADWAVNGELAEAMCAQLGVRHQPDGIFAGRHGRRRLVVIDGMVGCGTIDAVVDQLLDGENVEVWATQADPDAAPRLKGLRSGSRLNRIPDAVLDTYRRRKADRSPFGGARTEEGSAL